MQSIISLFLISVYTALEFISYIPQIVKIIKTKHADDLSLASWASWVISDVCYLLYVLLESPEIGVIFTASLSLFFVIFVYVLTFIYQHHKKPVKRIYHGKRRK